MLFYIISIVLVALFTGLVIGNTDEESLQRFVGVFVGSMFLTILIVVYSVSYHSLPKTGIVKYEEEYDSYKDVYVKLIELDTFVHIDSIEIK